MDLSYTANYLFLVEGHTQPVMDVCFSPDATVAYSVSMDHTIKIWDLFTAKYADR